MTTEPNVQILPIMAPMYDEQQSELCLRRRGSATYRILRKELAEGGSVRGFFPNPFKLLAGEIFYARVHSLKCENLSLPRLLFLKRYSCQMRIDHAES